MSLLSFLKFSVEISSLAWCFAFLQNLFPKTRWMPWPSRIIPKTYAKNEQINIWTLPGPSFSFIAREMPESLFPSCPENKAHRYLSDKQSGLSIWPYCFHPLISLILTVLMRKQMHKAANYLHRASEPRKKTQHLIVSFELGPFRSNKVELFKKGTLLLKTCFLFI